MKHQLKEQKWLLQPASARDNSSTAQVSHTAPEPQERREHQDLFFPKRHPCQSHTHLKLFHQLSVQRQVEQLLLLVHTIFQVKQAGLADVLQLAARLAHFCFLETHANTRAPAEHCEGPGTNLRGTKVNTCITATQQ